MTDGARRTAGSFALMLGLAALYFILLLTAVHAVGTDDALYYRCQIEAGILPGAGLSDDGLRALDAALARYLSGDGKALGDGGKPLALIWDGALRPAFNEKELAHMADCFGLFALLRRVRSRLIPWAVLLTVGGAWLLQDRKRARLCAWLSPLILLVPLGAFALWAAADFDGAFTFFHRVLFTNDMWLLDWRTDLLIRICPESMFAAMGLRIALYSLAGMLAAPLLATLLCAVWPKSKSNGGNQWNDNRATRRGAAQRLKTFDVGGKR